MITRIQQFIEQEGISVGAFEQKINASSGVIRKAIANNTDIQSRWLSSIADNYPYLNFDWLLTGKGEMLKSDESLLHKDEQNKELAAIIADRGIPLIPLDAFAGFETGNSNQVMEYECDQYVVPNFAGAEFLIQVKGSSMYPKYSSGDIVACKKLPIDTFFQWNKVYVIDSEQGVLIKRVKKTNTPNTILLVSENKDYDPFELDRGKITSLAIVLGVIRLE